MAKLYHLVTSDDRVVVFSYTAGAHRLDLNWVALLLNGNEVMRDTHPGKTGVSNSGNSYRLKVGALAIGGKYELKAKVRTAGGNDSTGIISLGGSN